MTVYLIRVDYRESNISGCSIWETWLVWVSYVVSCSIHILTIWVTYVGVLYVLTICNICGCSIHILTIWVTSLLYRVLYISWLYEKHDSYLIVVSYLTYLDYMSNMTVISLLYVTLTYVLTIWVTWQLSHCCIVV